MTNISQIEINNTTYDIADNQSRDDISNIWSMIYPIGSIYMSVNSTSPSVLFGGTWERIAGKFLLGATDNGSTGSSILSNASVAAGNSGGEAAHTLTGSESGVPAHSHSLNGHTHVIGEHTHGFTQPTVPKHSHTLNSHTHTTTIDHGHSDTIAAKTPKFTHSVTQPVHTLYYKANTAASGSGVRSGPWKSTDSNVTSITAHRTTNVAVGDHAATACTMSGSVTNFTGSKTSGGPSNNNTSEQAAVATTGGAVGNVNNRTSVVSNGPSTTNTANNTAANASSSHNNMPPFLAVYIWKRTG